MLTPHELVARLLIVLVEAAGGEVEVSHSLLAAQDHLNLLIDTQDDRVKVSVVGNTVLPASLDTDGEFAVVLDEEVVSEEEELDRTAEVVLY